MTFQGCPRIVRAERVRAWDDVDIAKALGGESGDPAFGEWGPAHWKYLAKFLDSVKSGEKAWGRLFQMLRAALPTVPVGWLSDKDFDDVRCDVRRVVAHLPADRRLALPGWQT